MTSDPEHVQVDREGRRVVLSRIFEWYAEDFESHAGELGAGSTVLDWIVHHADDATSTAIREAREAGFDVEHAPYDWSLNKPGT